MGKLLVLSFVILLALVSLTGWLFLSEKITTGDMQIAAGQEKVDEGQPKLDAGKQELADGKEEYKKAKGNLFYVLVDKLLKGGKGFEEGRRQIAEGQDLVDAGQKRMDAGKLKLSLGAEELRLARRVRFACALGAIFFASLSIVLGFYWRRALARLFVHTNA